MPFLQLTLPCTDATQPRIEHALEAVGALGITLGDAHADAPDEQAIFEPGVGEQPLWGEMMLTALFEAGTSRDTLLHALQDADAGIDWTQCVFEDIADQDWERAWMDDYQPLRFGRRTWIVPWNRDLPGDAEVDDAAVVRLDPGLAFGSGTHPTTSLCLRWLDALADSGALKEATVLDFGCGSGILALAALRLGAARAVGIDNDPQALIATHDNAERNGLDARIDVFMPADAPGDTYPVVVANILASALIAMVDTIAATVAPSGRIALSGILDGQQDDVIDAYSPYFDALHVAIEGDWVRVDGVRRA